MSEARVPVLAHLEGLCHVYVHAKADLAKARAIVLNAKMRRTGVCGAAETLLIDRAILTRHRHADPGRSGEGGLRNPRRSKRCARVFPRAKPATEEDWRTEYLDAIIAVRAVDGVEEAIRHIETLWLASHRVASSPRTQPPPSVS